MPVPAARRALLLSGSLGMGHDVVAQACASSLARRGWQTETLDAMALLGATGGRMGEQVFRRMLAVPALYDGFHFAHLRPGTRLARLVDNEAARQVVPRLRAHLATDPADLVLSVFSTGAAAAARLKAEAPGRITVAFCSDATAHRLWVHPGTDLFLVTSQVAACSVRRYLPEAAVVVVPTPVRGPFYRPPSRPEARARFDVPDDDRCVLLMSGAWGLGPVAQAAVALADSGVWVLAVAGRNAGLGARLREEARQHPRLVPFGYTDQVPAMMSAADLVITASGDTCSEARVIGRDVLILDVVPGHGRDNLQHELERGNAEVTNPDADSVVASALAYLRRMQPTGPRNLAAQQDWDEAFCAALARVGLG